MAFAELFNEIQTNPTITVGLSGAAGGAVAGTLTNSKVATRVLKMGDAATIGGLAWHAYQRYRTEPRLPPNLLDRDRFEVRDDRLGLIIGAVVAAAHVDGQLTDAEKKQIRDYAISIGASSTELTMLATEPVSPLTIDELVDRSANTETDMDIYVASLLVIDRTGEAGMEYLADLAAAFEFPAELVESMHHEVTQSLSRTH